MNTAEYRVHGEPAGDFVTIMRSGELAGIAWLDGDAWRVRNEWGRQLARAHATRQLAIEHAICAHRNQTDHSPQEIVDAIADAYRKSRGFWQADDSRATDALAICEELVCMGLATDDETGPRALEGRVLAATDGLSDNREAVTAEDVGEAVAVALGLVTEAEVAA